ncbi:MAG: 23S rRNA pseudouridine(1911/1915/1917) synthase RluD [Betaproteobacteria bacterium]
MTAPPPARAAVVANAPGTTRGADEPDQFEFDDEDVQSAIVPAAHMGQRLDQSLARLFPDFSRSRLQTWLAAGRIIVDGARAESARKVRGGEVVMLAAAPDPREVAFVAESIPLDIVDEDDALIVIDKPAGLVVHPGSGNWSGTLLNGLLAHHPPLASVPRAGIVHRLDKDTSGLLVIAKTLVAQTDLVRQLQARSVRREYLALVAGHVERNGSVDAPIGRHPRERTMMAIVSTGKPAITHYAVLERYAACTLLRCRLETGRTHQIRVHLNSIGHPLIGDPVYRGKALPAGIAFGRQALHAQHLGLLHPASGVPVQWSSPIPDDIGQLLAELPR